MRKRALAATVESGSNIGSVVESSSHVTGRFRQKPGNIGSPSAGAQFEMDSGVHPRHWLTWLLRSRIERQPSKAPLESRSSPDAQKVDRCR
jgi:hypothetical protein